MKALGKIILQLAGAGGAAFGVGLLVDILLEGECGITRMACGLLAGFTLGPALGLMLLQPLLHRNWRANPPGAIAAVLLGFAGAITTLYMIGVTHSGSAWVIGLIGVTLVSTAAYNLLASRKPGTKHAME